MPGGVCPVQDQCLVVTRGELQWEAQAAPAAHALSSGPALTPYRTGLPPGLGLAALIESIPGAPMSTV